MRRGNVPWLPNLACSNDSTRPNHQCSTLLHRLRSNQYKTKQNIIQCCVPFSVVSAFKTSFPRADVPLRRKTPRFSVSRGDVGRRVSLSYMIAIRTYSCSTGIILALGIFKLQIRRLQVVNVFLGYLPWSSKSLKWVFHLSFMTPMCQSLGS